MFEWYSNGDSIPKIKAHILLSPFGLFIVETRKETLSL